VAIAQFAQSAGPGIIERKIKSDLPDEFKKNAKQRSFLFTLSSPLYFCVHIAKILYRGKLKKEEQ